MNYIIDRVEDHEYYYNLFIENLQYASESNFVESFPKCNVKTFHYTVNNILGKSLIDTFLNLSNLKDLITTNYGETKWFGGWLNRYGKGEFQEAHKHYQEVGDPDLVYVYFLKIPEGQHFFNFCDKDGNNKKYINEKSGDVIIFDPRLYHSVDPNTSDDYRYTIAGNIYLK